MKCLFNIGKVMVKGLVYLLIRIVEEDFMVFDKRLFWEYFFDWFINF